MALAGHQAPPPRRAAAWVSRLAPPGRRGPLLWPVLLLVAAGCGAPATTGGVDDAGAGDRAQIAVDAGADAAIAARDASLREDGASSGDATGADRTVTFDAGGAVDSSSSDVTGDSGAVVEENCARYPYRAETLLAERVGFGRNASGGDPGNLYRVTTLASSGSGSLRAALESSERYWIVFEVNGVITHQNPVRVRSNKTVDGRGRDITVRGTLRLESARNVILSDIKVENDLEGHCTQAGDVILITGTGDADPASYTSRDIWIHHVEAYNGGDGLIDIRGGSRITLSWNHLHTHKKGMLCALTQDDQPATGMRVTFHHNFFDRITLRGPQFLYGWAHYFNNYQFEWYEYGAGSLNGAQLLSEGNIYEARPGTYCLPPCPDPNPCGDNDFAVSKKALVTFWTDGNGHGDARSVEDLLLNGAEVEQRNAELVFDPAAHYRYSVEVADDALKRRIAAQAGPRTTYCQ